MYISPAAEWFKTKLQLLPKVIFLQINTTQLLYTFQREMSIEKVWIMEQALKNNSFNHSANGNLLLFIVSFLVCQKMRAGQQHLFLGNYLSRTLLLLNLSVLRTFRQRGTPKWKKGEEQIKPDKNRHFLPLFPLRFPLWNPFPEPLFSPLLPIFTGIVFLKSIGRKFMSPYFPAVSLSSTFLRQPAAFLYGGKCITESKCCCPGENLTW